MKAQGNEFFEQKKRLCGTELTISRRIGRFRGHQRAGFEARALVQRLRGSEQASIFQKYLARARARARAPTVGARRWPGPACGGPLPSAFTRGEGGGGGRFAGAAVWGGVLSFVLERLSRRCMGGGPAIPVIACTKRAVRAIWGPNDRSKTRRIRKSVPFLVKHIRRYYF